VVADGYAQGITMMMLMMMMMGLMFAFRSFFLYSWCVKSYFRSQNLELKIPNMKKPRLL